MSAARTGLGARSAASVLSSGILLVSMLLAAARLAAAAEYAGEVTFSGLPVPGVTVTASSGDRQLVTTTDERGRFRFPDAAAGVWTIRVEMLGFDPITR